jgi:hypothetical protein
MFILLPTTIISLLLTSSAYAFQIEDRKCYTDLCLQSFKWCEPGHGDIDDCDFLENVYLLSPYAGGGPALVWNQSYEIKWTRKDADTPVTIRWAFMRLFEGQVRSRVGADWEYSEYTLRISDKEMRVWTNIKNRCYRWKHQLHLHTQQVHVS